MFMASETLPWDRKDFLKERKHERSESLGSVARWRDSSYHSYQDFGRWGPADFRRPPGHGKQGGWHLFSDDSGHGYGLSRCSDKMLEEEKSRLPVARGDGKYGRSNRENRSFSQRDWRGHSWETINGSVNLSRRLPDVTSNQRSVDDMLTYPSHPHSDFANTWDPHGMKEQHDKMGINGLGTDWRYDRESSLGSIDWRPFKWTRTGSLSSRGSGFSNSSSSRSFDGADTNETKTELQPKYATAIESHSGDAAACVTSAAPSEDMTSRKKPRLNWGEGLAKFEKKKVEGPDVCVIKDGPVLCASNRETGYFLGSGLADKSPKVTGFSDCASPATPSSVACSSSPGVDDKVYGKAASHDNDASCMSGSPVFGPQNNLQRFPFNLENLDINSLTSLGSSVIELLQYDDQSSVDSSLVRSTAMNKLLIWKADVSKVLEVTETEIDSLENELKSLKSESGMNNTKSCEEHAQVTHMLSRPVPLQVVSCANPDAEKMPLSNRLHTAHVNGEEENVDSPGSATSKFVELPPLIKAVPQCNRVGHDNYSGDLNVGESTSLKCLVPCSTWGEASVSGCGDGSMFEETNDGMGATSAASLSSGTEVSLYNIIVASNKDSANRACKVFDKLLPEDCCQIGNMGATSDWFSSSGVLVKEKVAERKRFAIFKERVITIQYKAFQHLGKEHMHLFSARKFHPKSHKKLDVGLRTTDSSCQKHRSSNCSCFAYPAGNPSLVPTSEMVNFTTKLLSDSQVQVHRNTLKMPALILDEKEKIMSRFLSSNGLVEDPLAFERERAMINRWTLKEKEVFFEKLAACGKDFRKIASFLDHKTTADCVEFYYKNHKSDYFEKIKRKQNVDKLGKLFLANTDLVVSGKKWSHEMNVSSLEILSAAAVVAGHADGITGNQKMCTGSFLLGAYGKIKTSKGEDNVLPRSRSFDMLGDERESVAADVLAGLCGSFSSEATSSCFTSSVDPTECNRDRKCLQVNLVSKQPLMPDVTQKSDDDTCSDEGCGEMDPTDWTDEEKLAFLQAVSSFGKDFLMISQSVRTRSQDQCKVFFSKARRCLELDLVHARPENVGSPAIDDANGDGSDIDNACFVETGSVTGIDKADTKTDQDIPSSATNTYHNESNPVEARDMSTYLNESKGINGAEVGEDNMDDMVSDFCEMKDEINHLGSGDGNVLYSTEKSAFESRQTAIILSASMDVGKYKATILSDTDTDASAEEIIQRGQVNCVAEDKMVSKNSVGRLGIEVEERDLLLPGCLDDRDDKDEADARDVVELKNSLLSTKLNASLLSVGNSCSGLSVDTEIWHQVSAGNPHFPAKLMRISHSSATPLQDAGAFQCEKMASQDQLSSTCDFQDSRDRKSHTSCKNEQLHMSVRPWDCVEPAGIVQGYPLQMLIKKEVNGDVICSSSTTELPLLSHKIEQTSDHYKTKSRHLLDSEKTSRHGDVKLFGKILTNPSPTQKLNLSTKGKEENTIRHLNLSTNTSSLKFTGHHHSADGNSTILKFDHNMGLQNVPIRSYGFWDGNRIQTGFSALPDSALLLAKYRAAFSNYPTSSARLEQQSLHAFKSSEQHLNGASSFTTREHVSSNVGIDHHMFRSRDGPKIRPFMVDVKPHEDIYSETHRRNGFEAISSLQQQGRGMVGFNGVGRPGIHVVGSCSGVSDPVAAVKMHFSNSGRYGGLTGSILRQDESWAGKGDLGR